MSKGKIHSTDDIRKSFLDFFESQEHLKMPSASLLPNNDPTLLFTTAGMVPFKNFFSGIETPPSERVTSIQKCLRTTDLENVGITKRHMSFFEMLGNFSFGNYFKKEAIEYAWEYTSYYLPFDKNDIWVTIYQDDEDTYNLWHKHIGVSSNRIVRLGKKDNFWGPVGASGSCGPCSELYLDRGPSFSSSQNDTQPGSDGERFLEFWNLVFIQDYQQEDGSRTPLQKTGIDTGAGLERLASLVQGVDSVYDIDEFTPLKVALCKHFQTSYEKNQQTIRIILDHLRTLTFTISDGIYPSNDFRGYVLRRILRRAVLFAHQEFKYKKPTLYKFVDDIEFIYKKNYPELTKEKEQVTQFIKNEEERFLQTLQHGSEKLMEILEITQKSKTNTFSGEHAFLLYDTYGFPLELTKEIAKKNNLNLDFNSFELEMEKQKQKGRSSWNLHEKQVFPKINEKTEFIGYNKSETISNLIGIYQGDNSLLTADINKNTYLFVTSETPFYPEGGGQKPDFGTIKTKTAIANIIDVQKHGDTIFHCVSLEKGSFKIEEDIVMEIEQKRRSLITAHHSATHLLHMTLQQILGSHIRQTGSLVDQEHLRFDFLHHQKLSLEQIENVEKNINTIIKKSEPTKSEILPIEKAKESGAMMFFGEKYGDYVRVVSIGSQSKELCGGTHVSNTSDVQNFIILKESSPGAGNRRIEAMCTISALNEVNSQKVKLQNTLNLLIKSSNTEISLSAQKFSNQITQDQNLDLYIQFQKVRRIKEDVNELTKKQRKTNKKVNSSYSTASVGIHSEKYMKELQSKLKNEDHVIYLFSKIEKVEIQDLRILSDTCKSKLNTDLSLFFSVLNNKWFIFCSANKKLIEKKKIHLGNILKHELSITDLKGGGGGKPNSAQASGSFDINNDINNDLQNLLNLILQKVLSSNIKD